MYNLEEEKEVEEEEVEADEVEEFLDDSKLTPTVQIVLMLGVTMGSIVEGFEM